VCGFAARAVALCAALVGAFGLGAQAQAAEVSCVGESCAALAFADAAGCIEIRNTENSPILVTFSTGTRKSRVVLRPFGRQRMQPADRCISSRPDEVTALSIEARAAGAPTARPVANCSGEACSDIALSSGGGCLTVRNLGNGYVAFEGAGAVATLLDPYAQTTLVAASGGCVKALASAAGAVAASYRRTPWAADGSLVGRCTGEACAELSQRKVEGCVMFANNAARWVRFKMSFVPGNATGITSALYEVAPGKEVMPLPGNMCLRSLAETPYVATFVDRPGSGAAGAE
jgi:hypothetical protein